jgi:hypothetical protein
MRTSQVKTIMVIVTALSIIGFGLNAMADDGESYGRMGKGRYHDEDGGKGYGPGAGYCGRYGDSLSEEVRGKIDAERKAFHEETRGLRQQMVQKNLELQAELAKQAPDAEKAGGIQKEISSLRAQMDEKHLEHRLRLKAIDPDLGLGYGGRWGGMRSGFGRGARGHDQGHCWE